MSEHPPPHGHLTPGEPIPHPLATTYGTRWAEPTQDYPTAADGAAGSGWAEDDAPRAVPPVIEPPALRVWAPSGDGPDTAA
jgi:hypothetical protein